MATAVATSPCGEFLQSVREASSRVLLLDYDGTIAPFCASRDRAFPYPGIPQLIERIMTRCNTRVTLVTGRLARELPPLLGIIRPPEIWGSHGLEHLDSSGNYQSTAIQDDAAAVLAEATAWLEHDGLGALTEVKHGSVAVHWRGLPREHIQEARTGAYRVLTALAGIADLRLGEFDGGLELRVRTCTKAHAVRNVLNTMNDEVPVAYLGDDTTDEDAFRELSGRGLTVLVRPTYRFTAASVWMRPPDDVVQFLAEWACACGGEQ